MRSTRARVDTPDPASTGRPNTSWRWEQGTIGPQAREPDLRASRRDPGRPRSDLRHPFLLALDAPLTTCRKLGSDRRGGGRSSLAGLDHGGLPVPRTLRSGWHHCRAQIRREPRKGEEIVHVKAPFRRRQAASQHSVHRKGVLGGSSRDPGKQQRERDPAKRAREFPREIRAGDPRREEPLMLNKPRRRRECRRLSRGRCRTGGTPSPEDGRDSVGLPRRRSRVDRWHPDILLRGSS